MGLPAKGGIGGLAIEQNDGTEEGLALHAPLDVETALIDGSNVIYNSVASITNTGPIEFIVPRDNECSFILNQTRIHGHFIVEDNDGGAVTDAQDISLVNHFAACLFSQVEVYLNGTQVCDLSSAVSYPWKMFLQSYLSYNSHVKETYLSTEGYFPETHEEINWGTTPGNKDSLKKRRQLISGLKKVYFSSRLAVDLFYTDRFLPPNVDIKIKLVRSSEKFGVLHGVADKSFKIVLKDLKLQMRKVLPTLEERERFKARLLREPCYLPFKASRMRNYVIPIGVSSINIANISNGILPKSVYFVMIHNQALSHDPTKNPFNFQHFNLSSYNLKKNGQCVFPRPFQIKPKDGDAVELYRHLYDSIGISHSNQSIGMSYEDFLNGRFVLAADLTPDQCNSFHAHPDVYGNLDLELGFSEVTPHPIYLIALSIFNSGIKLDQFQQVIKGSD